MFKGMVIATVLLGIGFTAGRLPPDANFLSPVSSAAASMVVQESSQSAAPDREFQKLLERATNSPGMKLPAKK